MSQVQPPPAPSLAGPFWHTASGHSPWVLALLKVQLQLPCSGSACPRGLCRYPGLGAVGPWGSAPPRSEEMLGLENAHICLKMPPQEKQFLHVEQ